MKLETQRVDAQTMGVAFVTDPDLRLPRRPRFISELVAVPFEDGVLYVGGEQGQVIRGRSARGTLQRVVPVLDGTRTLDELAAAFPGDRLRDVVSLLHSRGLLEDGVPVPRDGTLSEVGRFVGRFVDVSRANDNRDEALARLAATTVGISGPPPLVAQAARARGEWGRRGQT